MDSPRGHASFPSLQGRKSWIFFIFFCWHPRPWYCKWLQRLKYFFPTSGRNWAVQEGLLDSNTWFFQTSCLLYKTLSAELKLFIAQSTDCLIKAQANPPQRHPAQDSSRSSPKLSNKIIRGLFPGPSTEHERKQRVRQWGEGYTGQSPPQTRLSGEQLCSKTTAPVHLFLAALLHTLNLCIPLQTVFLAASPSPFSSLFHKEKKIIKCCAMVKKYKRIWKVLQEMPTFGDFLPVAFLHAEHHFQFPTLTFTQFLQLHLIQQLQWPGHIGHGKPAQARASSPEFAAMRGL